MKLFGPRSAEEWNNGVFIKKEDLFKYVTEEDIFELVFKFKPVEFLYTTSPFRVDKNPDCLFERDVETGKLRFIDWGNSATINGVKMRNMDCFDVVKIYYKLPTFYSTLNYISKNLLKNNTTPLPKSKFKSTIKNRKKIVKKETRILLQTRDFQQRDKEYWSKYGVTKAELIEDLVFPLEKYIIKRDKKRDTMIKCSQICYAYTEFEGRRKKVYNPTQSKYKFITNCKADDIGGIKHLFPFGRQLVITKSYKDYRVLRNFGLNVIWFQNEGMIPKDKIILPILRCYRKIVILFDNDTPGITASKVVREYFISKGIKYVKTCAVPIYNNVTDPSDLYYYKGKERLREYLLENKIL